MFDLLQIATGPREEGANIMSPKKKLSTAHKVFGVVLIVTFGATGAVIGAWDADAHPGHGNCEPTEEQQGHPCDPLTFILGVPSVPESGAETWQDLMLPPEAGLTRPVLGARVGEAQ